MINKNNLYPLIICINILLFSIFLTIDNGIVCFPIIKYPVHGFCLFKEIFGIDCPMCGLTRSFVSISHLHFADGWRFNRVGILIYLFVLWQIPYRSYLLWKEHSLGKYASMKTSKNYNPVGLTFAILIINWFLNII